VCPLGSDSSLPSVVPSVPVQPTYPETAKAAQVSGPVTVEIEIDEEGNVAAARAISGHPLLKAAAVEAARQWQFAPTMLEGRAVRVVGSLTFNFALDN
jgi:protein TonB